MEGRKRPERLSYTLGRRGTGEEVVGGLNAVASCGSGSTATAGRDGVVRLWSDGLSPTGRYEGHTDWVNALQHVEGVGLLSCSSDTQIKLWRDPQEGGPEEEEEDPCIATYCVHTDYVKALSYSPESRRIVSGSLDGTAACIDPTLDFEDDASPQVVSKALLYKGVYCAASKACLSAFGTTESALSLVDWRAGTVVGKLNGHKDMVRDVHFVGDTQLVTASSDRSIKVWDLRSDRPMCSIRVHTAPVWCARQVDLGAADGISLVSGDKSGAVYVSHIASSFARINTVLLCVTQESEAVEDLQVVGGSGPQQLWAASSSLAHPLHVFDMPAALRSQQLLETSPPPHELRRSRDRSASHMRHSDPHAIPQAGNASVASSLEASHSLGRRAGVQGVSPQDAPLGGSPPPAVPCADLPVHCLSRASRHNFSLAHGRQSLEGHYEEVSREETAEEAEARKKRQAAERRQWLIDELGVAVRCSGTLQGGECVVSARLLDNRRHCVLKTSEGAVEVWDVTSGRMCEREDAADADEKAEQLRATYAVKGQPNPASWCSVDTTTGALTVRLDHPSCFALEMMLPDRDALTPYDPIPVGKQQRSPRRGAQLLRINVGESLVLGLFCTLLAPLKQVAIVERGSPLPADTCREAWYKAEAGRVVERGGSAENTKGPVPLVRVRFELPPDTLLCLWGRREVWPHQLNSAAKHGVPEVGTKVVYPHDLHRHAQHVCCAVGGAGAAFSLDGRSGARLPGWISDALRHVSLNTPNR